ncbi:MAG: efflux RND transporter periplasmic adaptor subunit [Muribaculaceae bacterium]|nr:efflux RND transporter periplasmic adaptor subunit [Muribaculaceae bacterium]
MAMLILVAVVAGMAIWGILHLKPSDTTVQGQADCEVVRISGKLAGRLVELYVKEGDYVQKGQRLAKIYSSTTDATLSKAKEMKNVAASQNQKVERGTRYEIITSAQKMVDQAKSAKQQAQAAEEISRKTYERLNNLFNEGVVSEQKRDEAKAALDASTATVKTATAAVEAAEAQLEMARNGAQAEDKAASQSMENAAQATVREVEAVLEDQYLIAPCDGEIASIYPHLGELVIMGSPIMTISLLEDMWVAFNVREEKLNDLEMGKEVKVMIPALKNKETTMKIFYVHDMGSYATWSATKAYGDYDSKTFEVKARPLSTIPNFRPGMSVLLK